MGENWRKFAEAAQSSGQTVQEKKDVFMVKADVHACFDTVRHGKLMEVLLRNLKRYEVSNYRSGETGSYVRDRS